MMNSIILKKRPSEMQEEMQEEASRLGSQRLVGLERGKRPLG